MKVTFSKKNGLSHTTVLRGAVQSGSVATFEAVVASMVNHLNRKEVGDNLLQRSAWCYVLRLSIRSCSLGVSRRTHRFAKGSAAVSIALR